MKQLESKNATLEKKKNDLKFRSLHENLLCLAVADQHNENCKTPIKQLIREKLEIGQHNKMHRAHRLGEHKGRVRPIVVNFHSYTDRELIKTTINDISNF